MDALEAGHDVMVFSDNVPIEQEVALKRYAADRGLLVMGPDCGTAVLGGLGLGFANVVHPARGHRRRLGHRLPAGARAARPCRRRRHPRTGRRRARPVRRDRRAGHPRGDARGSTRTPRSNASSLISKPPADEVRPRSGRMPRAVHRRELALLGAGQPDLTAATEARAPRLGRRFRTGRWPAAAAAACGGGSCAGSSSAAPSPARPADRDRGARRGAGHALVDFGDDVHRRPGHPMIDPTLGSTTSPEPRPTGHSGAPARRGPRPRRRTRPGRLLAPAIARSSTVVVTVVGTAAEPRASPARSKRSPTRAPRYLSTPRPPAGGRPRGRDRHEHRTVVNVGTDLLADAVRGPAVDVARVDWRPPMAGPSRLATVAADRAPAPSARPGARCSASPRPRRRRASLRGLGPRARPVPARRSADHLGPASGPMPGH